MYFMSVEAEKGRICSSFIISYYKSYVIYVCFALLSLPLLDPPYPLSSCPKRLGPLLSPSFPSELLVLSSPRGEERIGGDKHSNAQMLRAAVFGN